MNAELDLYGVYIPGLLALMVLAWLELAVVALCPGARGLLQAGLAPLSV